MNPSRRAAAAVLSALIAAPNPGFACGLFGAKSVEVQTGGFVEKVREEKLVVQPVGFNTKKIVKLFVAPAGIRAQSIACTQLTPQELTDHKSVGQAGLAILGADATTSRADREMTTRGPSRAITIEAGEAYKTRSNVKCVPQAITGNYSWDEVKTAFDIESSNDDQYYSEFINRVKGARRGLYAAVINLQDSGNTPQARSDAYALAVRIPYSNYLDIALDKTLEYTGSYDQAASFATGYGGARREELVKALLAARKVVFTAKEESKRIADRGDKGVDFFVNAGNGEKISLTVDADGVIFVLNRSFRPTPSAGPTPSQGDVRGTVVPKRLGTPTFEERWDTKVFKD